MKYLILLSLVITFTSCGKNKDLDAEGRLSVTALTSTTGGFHFTPMENNDSNDVKNFLPVVYHYDGSPYTGKIVFYNDDKKVTLEGNLKNGIADGAWKFYYASAVLQMEGSYTNGLETGFWTSYYGKNRPKITKYYDDKGYMLMRKEYFDNGKVKNYQNIKCPQFGDRERRIQFSYSGEIEYIDAEREIGSIPPAELNKLLQDDGLMQE